MLCARLRLTRDVMSHRGDPYPKASLFSFSDSDLTTGEQKK